MTTTTNPIFNFAVSEASAADAYKDMVMAVTSLALTEQGFIDQCVRWEDEYKRETEDAPMPNAWRSNKSVIKNALRAGIPLLRGDGTPRGKTEIQNAIKDTKEDRTPEEKAGIMARTFIQYCRKHGLDIMSVLDCASMSAE